MSSMSVMCVEQDDGQSAQRRACSVDVVVACSRLHTVLWRAVGEGSGKETAFDQPSIWKGRLNVCGVCEADWRAGSGKKGVGC